MTQDEMNNIVERDAPQHKKPDNKMLKIRNALNILFILGAIAGVLYYYFEDHNTGIIIILCSMSFKFIETTIRILRL